MRGHHTSLWYAGKPSKSRHSEEPTSVHESWTSSGRRRIWGGGAMTRFDATINRKTLRRTRPGDSKEASMTYTIIGRCSRTGLLGIGITTYSLAVGGYCPSIRADLAAVSSQAFANPVPRDVAMQSLDAGHTPQRSSSGYSDRTHTTTIVRSVSSAGTAPASPGPAMGPGHGPATRPETASWRWATACPARR